MLKIQMALIALLVGCLAFTSCDLVQELVTPEMPEEMMPEEMMPEEMMPEEMMATYTSWLSGTLPGPVGSGAAAHGAGARIIYINDIGAMALQGGMTTFPAGTMVVKEIMSVPDASGETSVEKVERMEKSDDPMHADTSGWLYNGMGSQAGCHGCHAKAGTDDVPGMDAVFTTDALMASMADMDDMDDMDDDMADVADVADVADDMADVADDMADVADDMADVADDMADVADDMADVADDMADVDDDMADMDDDMADVDDVDDDMADVDDDMADVDEQ